MYLTQGQLLNVTAHSYADFHVVGTYVVTRNVDITSLIDQIQAQDCASWQKIVHLKEHLLNSGILQPMPIPTLWLGDDFEPPEMQNV